MKKAYSWFFRFPRITVFRVILVGLVVWSISVGAGLYTDTASLPRFALHWSPWLIAFLRKWPASLPFLWLAATGLFARWQMRRLPPAPPATHYPIRPLLSDEQLRWHSRGSSGTDAAFPGVDPKEERVLV